MFIGKKQLHALSRRRICSVLFVCVRVLCSKMWYRSQKVSVSNLRVQLRNSISIIDHKHFCTYAFSPSPLNLSPDTHLSFLLLSCFQFSCVFILSFRSFVILIFSSSFKSFFRYCFISKPQNHMICIMSTESNCVPLITKLTWSRVS